MTNILYNIPHSRKVINVTEERISEEFSNQSHYSQLICDNWYTVESQLKKSVYTVLQ